MSTVTKTELQAMLKLVQMVCHSDQYSRIDKQDWIDYCTTAFGWSQEDANYITDELRRKAGRELK